MSLIERAFREKIVLVGVVFPSSSADRVDESLDELSLLVDTAGADEAARIVQARDAPDSRYFIGKGKAEELKEVAVATDCDTVVFDDELSPAQQFNLEKLLGRTAIDRTAVILDIFAQNASSLEGKAQVQLAMYRYRLPRLRGKGLRLSQQAGGIGARRGPGETQLEVDRRRIERHIHALESDLRDIARHRETQRKRRRRSRLQHVAIVGYTNAGKSTLLNRLTDAGVLVEDRLFATLDATTRRLQLPRGETVLVTDTVGFIRKLPHQLVEAFKSTLDVVTEADLLVHLVDASAVAVDDQIAAVRRVLDEIGAGALPELLVFNKTDLVTSDDVDRLIAQHPGSHAMSTLTGNGVEAVLQAASDRLRSLRQVVELVVPYDRGDVLAAIHREGEVLVEQAAEGAMRLRVRMDEPSLARFADYVVNADEVAAT